METLVLSPEAESIELEITRARISGQLENERNRLQRWIIEDRKAGELSDAEETFLITFLDGH